MERILKQRNLFVTKEFELTDGILKIKVSTPISKIENQVKFEDISKIVSRKMAPNTTFLVFSILLFLGVVITTFSFFFETKEPSSTQDIMFYVVLLMIFLLFMRLTYENIVSLWLFTGGSVILYANSPRKEVVNDFIDLLHQEQKEYLLNRYAVSDPFLTEDQMSVNLKWLWERKIINQEELQQLREELLPKPQASHTVIGFKISK